nr:hypothetical protein Iba_chr08eCG6530 [Ipomoea batatas]
MNGSYIRSGGEIQEGMDKHADIQVQSKRGEGRKEGIEKISYPQLMLLKIRDNGLRNIRRDDITRPIHVGRAADISVKVRREKEMKTIPVAKPQIQYIKHRTYGYKHSKKYKVSRHKLHKIYHISHISNHGSPVQESECSAQEQIGLKMFLQNIPTWIQR